jgi:chemotaxis protein MotB
MKGRLDMFKQRRHSHKPHADRRQTDFGGWQMVYTGFVLILLCFFIMLTSFASLEQSKISRFTRAFSTAVTVFGEGRSLEKGSTMIDTHAMIMDKEDKMAQLFKTVRALKQRSELDQVTLSKGSRGVVMTLSDKLLFSSGDANLSASAKPLLVKVGQIIQTVQVPVEIEGHTDNVPIRTASYPSNWELSTARAVNVLRFLIEHHAISTQKLSAVGFASYQPAASNASVQGRAKNRRVEIIFKLN